MADPDRPRRYVEAGPPGRPGSFQSLAPVCRTGLYRRAARTGTSAKGRAWPKTSAGRRTDSPADVRGERRAAIRHPAAADPDSAGGDDLGAGGLEGRLLPVGEHEPAPKRRFGLSLAIIGGLLGFLAYKFLLPLVIVGVAGQALGLAFGGPFERLPSDVQQTLESASRPRSAHSSTACPRGPG